MRRKDDETTITGKPSDRTPGFGQPDDDSTLGEEAASLGDGTLLMTERDGVLVASGDIDMHEAAEFGEFATSYMERTARPRFDLSRVAFIDSAGLATLVTLSRRAKEHSKTLRVIVTGSPRRVLKVTGIDRVLIVED